jgi:hypothetical protein
MSYVPVCFKCTHKKKNINSFMVIPNTPENRLLVAPALMDAMNLPISIKHTIIYGPPMSLEEAVAYVRADAKTKADKVGETVGEDAIIGVEDGKFVTKDRKTKKVVDILAPKKIVGKKKKK